MNNNGVHEKKYFVCAYRWNRLEKYYVQCTLLMFYINVLFFCNSFTDTYYIIICLIKHFFSGSFSLNFITNMSFLTIFYLND